MHTPTRIAALMMLGALTASIANAARTRPLPWVLDYQSSIIDNKQLESGLLVTLEDLRVAQQNATAAIIDARSTDLYAAGHLEGAYNVPSNAIEASMASVYQNVPQSQRIIIYCDGGNCEASHRVAEFLTASGFKDVRMFKEGWELLGPSDLPKATGSEPMAGFDPNAAEAPATADEPPAAGG